MSKCAVATHGKHILRIHNTMSNMVVEVILNMSDEKEYLLIDLTRVPRQKKVTNAQGKRGEMRSTNILTKTFISLWGVQQYNWPENKVTMVLCNIISDIPNDKTFDLFCKF